MLGLFTESIQPECTIDAIHPVSLGIHIVYLICTLKIRGSGISSLLCKAAKFASHCLIYAYHLLRYCKWDSGTEVFMAENLITTDYVSSRSKLINY